MNTNAKWIKTVPSIGETSPEFRKSFSADKKIKAAELTITSLGAYVAYINGRRVGDAFLTPGWTSYTTRVQSQTYDVKDMLDRANIISVICGKGWMFSALGSPPRAAVDCSGIAICAALEIIYEDGTGETILSDGSWEVWSSGILYSDHYNGEIIDLTVKGELLGCAIEDNEGKPEIVPQVGEFIKERERVFPSELIITPKGETVIDFGQNLAGYVEISVKGKKGDKVVISHAEVLDKDGNFYTANLRAADALMRYTISEEETVLKPMFTFQGFRYIRIDEFPGEVDLADFTAVAVYSDMKRTSRFVCGNDKINRLYSNTIWGQRSNFVDVPTDCPQRDERLGWTGDAEVFCKTAAINYDTEKFFSKWLGDVAIEQTPEGGVKGVVPTVNVNGGRISAAWGDVATVAPWEVYLAYGDKELLRRNYPMMKKWVEYMHNTGVEEYLWLGGNHYGDWLAMDAGYGIYKGATQTDFIASAYFAYSTSLVIRAGRVLGEDVSYFEDLYTKVRAKFRECFMKDGMPVALREYKGSSLDNGTGREPREIKDVTQTAIILILHFGLCDECEKPKLMNKLCELIADFDGRMTTGFVGTPYILHALSDNGRADLAYDLLLQEKNPSWLFSVNMGATTIWEHWDSINEEGKMWSTDMNSFNHYAYGSVFDWIFGDMMGIKVLDDGAGYEKIEIAPIPEKRIGFAEAELDTRCGKLCVSWRYVGDKVRYEIRVPEGSAATLKINGTSEKTVFGGCYTIIK